MNKKEVLWKELETTPESLLDEVIDFVQFLKAKQGRLSAAPDTGSSNFSQYRGIAKGLWQTDAQAYISDLRANDR